MLVLLVAFGFCSLAAGTADVEGIHQSTQVDEDPQWWPEKFRSDGAVLSSSLGFFFGLREEVRS